MESIMIQPYLSLLNTRVNISYYCSVITRYDKLIITSVLFYFSDFLIGGSAKVSVGDKSIAGINHVFINYYLNLIYFLIFNCR